MISLRKLVKLIDVFSVEFTPSLNVKTNTKYFSSVLGGVVTLIIYIFIAIYGLRLFQQWITFQMPFKVSTQEKSRMSFDSFFESYNNTIDISVVWNNDETENVFDKENAILIPVLYQINVESTDREQPPLNNLLSLYNETTDSIRISLKNFHLKNYIILLLPCLGNEYFLGIDEKCANQDLFNKVIQYKGMEIYYEFAIDKFNFYTNSIETSLTWTSTFIQNNFSTTEDIKFKTSHYNVITGFFQEHHQEYLLTTDFRSESYMSTMEYMTNYYQYYMPNVQNVYSAVYLYTDVTTSDVIISYPTIAEVLASIGSIMQSLLFFGFVIRRLNLKWMISEFRQQYRNKFFPEIIEIVKQKGKPYHYLLRDKKINKKSYQEFIKSVDEKINEKMNYQNLIYEISRIQIVLEDITTQYKILSSHFKYFQLDLILNRSDGEYHIYNYWDQKQILELQPKISLAPFTLNQSMHKQSVQYCRILSNDQELISPQSIPHINSCYLST